MVEVARILNLIGIEPMVLKGGTHLFDDLFGDLGFRMLRDLDLLIPETRLMDAVGVLLEHGYKIHGKGEPWTYQFRMMYREGDLVVVELHRHVGEQRHLLSPEEAFRHAVPLSAPSEPRVLSLCPTHRVLHSIFHAEIQNRAFELRWIPLRELVDLIYLERKYRDSIDWQDIRRRLGIVAEVHVELASTLLDMPRPWPATARSSRHARQRVRLYGIRWLGAVQDRWIAVTHPFKRSNIDYLYGTEANPFGRQVARLKQGMVLLIRYGKRLLKQPLT